MESVYLETTFISYLVARPSRDVIVAAHQQMSQERWEIHRSDFTCSVSQVVIDEVSAGDPAEIQKRLAIIDELPVLEVTNSAKELARAILLSGIVPPRAIRDAAHIAVAAVHQVDYLLTWNCRHLANANHAENSRGLRPLFATHAADLHSGRVDGRVKWPGKIRSLPTFDEFASNFRRNSTSILPRFSPTYALARRPLGSDW